MIVLTSLQILLSGGAKDLAVRTSVVNIILAAGGMISLLWLGNRIIKKLNTLEEMIRPIIEKNYTAMPAGTSEGMDGESYGDLKKAAKDLGKFAEAFRVHAGSSSEMEELLKPETNTAQVNKENLETLGRHLKEIEDAAGQAASALDSAGDYFSSFDELSREQTRNMEEVESRIMVTSELGKSIAIVIGESGKTAGDLKKKIIDGEEQSRNTHDIIKSTSKDLEKITGIAEIINEISEQTNILSMNAAIESAHAGAAGAGFAVVAEEIRKLAELTKENAADIQAVLRTLTRQITEALKASELSSRSFGLITSEMAAFTNTLGKVAGEALKSNIAAGEIKTVFAGSSGGNEKFRDRSVDIAAFSHSLRTLLEHIQSASLAAKEGAHKTGSEMFQSRANHKKAMDKVHDYLKETEELEGMFFSTADPPGIAPKIQIAAAPFIEPKPIETKPIEPRAIEQKTPEQKAADHQKAGDDALTLRFVRNEKKDSLSESSHAKDITTVHGSLSANVNVLSFKEINETGEAEKIKENQEEIDNSWRKDVAVKSPPRTVS